MRSSELHSEVRILRPIASALHRSKPNEMNLADFLNKAAANRCNLEYILGIEDNPNSCTCQHPFDNGYSDPAITAIVKWKTCLRCRQCLIADWVSYFIAFLVNNLTSEAVVHHYFTTPYCLRAKGTVEHLCRETLG